MTYIGSALSSPVQSPLPLAWVFWLQCINQFERRLDSTGESESDPCTPGSGSLQLCFYHGLTLGVSHILAACGGGDLGSNTGEKSRMREGTLAGHLPYWV